MVVEFQRWWVLKSKIFGQEHTPKGKRKLKFPLGMSVHQKWGIILENKLVQKLSPEKNGFTKKRSPKLIFLHDFFLKKIN